MSRENWTPERWARYRAYNQEWHNKNRKKAGNPERYAKYRAYQLAYYRANREKINMQKRAVTSEQKEQHRQWERNFLENRNGKERRRTNGRNWVRKRAGFTPELIDRLLEHQNHACAVCRRPFADLPRRYQADHCHDTNTPRGLLCFQCNILEGNLIAIGLTPIEFGQRLHDYLQNCPAKSLGQATAASVLSN